MSRGPQPPNKRDDGFRMKTKLLLAIFLCLLPLRSLAAQTLDEIIRKAIDARGGMDKIRAVQSERINGRVSFSQGFEGTLVLELKRSEERRVGKEQRARWCGGDQQE